MSSPVSLLWIHMPIQASINLQLRIKACRAGVATMWNSWVCSVQWNAETPTQLKGSPVLSWCWWKTLEMTHWKIVLTSFSRVLLLRIHYQSELSVEAFPPCNCSQKVLFSLLTHWDVHSHRNLGFKKKKKIKLDRHQKNILLIMHWLATATEKLSAYCQEMTNLNPNNVAMHGQKSEKAKSALLSAEVFKHKQRITLPCPSL